MTIKVLSRSPERLEDYDYREALEIHVDGVKTMSFHDGEPEDASLARDFGDVYSIPALLKKAYEAGVNGEEFVITEEETL
jgi:hypothetical protein